MKLAVSAGDHSGDIYGEALLKELQKQHPDIRFIGMGGVGLQRAGLAAIANLVPYSTVGFIEPLKYLFPIFAAYKKMVRLLKKEKPHALLLIDYQGFNMALARAAKKLGIKTIYFIAPQEWLWGTERGARKVAQTIDLIIAIFEKEGEVYKSVGGNVEYFGHPLPELLNDLPSREDFCVKNNVSTQKKIVGIFPGTRKHEIERHLPIILETCARLENSVPDVSFAMAHPGMVDRYRIPSSIRVTHDSRGLLKAASVAMGKPGTVQMEALFLGTPYIPFYKVSRATYFIGKRLLKIRLPYYTLVNLLSHKQVVPEFIQDAATPHALGLAIQNWLTEGSSASGLREDYESLRRKLDRGPVIPLVAKSILRAIAP